MTDCFLNLDAFPFRPGQCTWRRLYNSYRVLSLPVPVVDVDRPPTNRTKRARGTIVAAVAGARVLGRRPRPRSSSRLTVYSGGIRFSVRKNNIGKKIIIQRIAPPATMTGNLGMILYDRDVRVLGRTRSWLKYYNNNPTAHSRENNNNKKRSRALV